MTRPFKREYKMVWDGMKRRTPSGLTRADLMVNPKTGAIVSKAKHRLGKAAYKRSGLSQYRF